LFGFGRQRVFIDVLKMTDAQNLLAEYVRTGSDTAFRELVARYVDLVYSTALRLVDGDAHRAEDVAQTVFADLARQARTLSRDTMLGGWLHRHACFIAANIMRGERRRQFREREAMEMNAPRHDAGTDFSLIAPILDESINQLNEEDRTAILLRFFEQRDFRSVGEALGSNEDAARMRVTRALEKLNSMLKRHGIATGAAALGLALSANAVQSAPIGLAATISAAVVLTGTTVSTSTAVATTKVIAMTALQKTIIGAALVAAVGTGAYEAHQASQLREQNQTLRQKQTSMAVQSQQLQQALNDATNQLVGLLAENAQWQSGSNETELLKLRGEVARLRENSEDLSRLSKENNDLKMKLSELEGRWFNVTNSPQFSMPYFPRGKWNINGNGDPVEILLAAAKAATDGDEAKLSKLISNTNNLSLFSKRRWANVKGIQLVSTEDVNNNGEETTIVNTIIMKQIGTRGQIDPNQPPALTDLMQSFPEMHRWYFSKTEAGWKITGGD
jgi:RNA polymerase sigma factor (sigma-70 family)